MRTKSLVTLATLLMAGILVLFIWSLKKQFSILPSSREFYIKVSSVFDSESGKLISLRSLSVRNGVIVGINEDPTKHALVVDLTDAYVLPGLIDLHTHLFLNDPSRGKDFSGSLKEIIRKPQARVDLALDRGQDLLKSGFTTVRDVGNSGLFLDLDMRKKSLDPAFTMPRMFVSGPGLTPQKGQFASDVPLSIVEQEYIPWAGKDIAAEVEDLITRGVDWIKLYADEDPSPAKAELQDLQKAVETARNHNIPVAIHAVFSESIEMAVKAHPQTIEHGYEASDNSLREMANKKIVLVPTDFFSVFVSFLPKSSLAEGYEKMAHVACERLQRARNTKVSIAFGSDNYFDLYPQISFSKFTMEVLKGYSNCGLSNAETLQAATIRAAKVLGDKDLGKLVLGAKADIIAVKKNPLEDIKALDEVIFVMKQGTIHKN